MLDLGGLKSKELIFLFKNFLFHVHWFFYLRVCPCLGARSPGVDVTDSCVLGSILKFRPPRFWIHFLFSRRVRSNGDKSVVMNHLLSSGSDSFVD